MLRTHEIPLQVCFKRPINLDYSCLSVGLLQYVLEHVEDKEVTPLLEVCIVPSKFILHFTK